MARQVRSEVTRQKILDSAMDVFAEVGYTAAGWGAIIERTGMTKGALYHHFDSKEALASDLIDAGSDILIGAFRGVCSTASPGLENMIHGTFVIAGVLGSDKTAQAAEQLIAALAGFNDAAARCCANLVAEMAVQAKRGIAEGDLRADVDPELLSESIVGAISGTRLLSVAMSRQRGGEGPVGELNELLSQIWMLLLPGVVAEASLPYFRQFLSREAMRHGLPPAAPGDG